MRQACVQVNQQQQCEREPGNHKHCVRDAQTTIRSQQNSREEP